MNPNTGRLSTYVSQEFPVGLDGSPEDIAKVSGAVRALDQDIPLEEARQQAMDELRRLNKAERNRGRR